MAIKYEYPMNCINCGIEVVPREWKKREPDKWAHAAMHGGNQMCNKDYQSIYVRPGGDTWARKKKRRRTTPMPDLLQVVKEGWRDNAACIGMEPSLFDDGGTDEARAACRSCPVINECFTNAVANDEIGMWADTTFDERVIVKIRK